MDALFCVMSFLHYWPLTVAEYRSFKVEQKNSMSSQRNSSDLDAVGSSQLYKLGLD